MGSGKFVTLGDNDDPRFFVDKKPFLVLFQIVADFCVRRNVNVFIDNGHFYFTVSVYFNTIHLMFVWYPFKYGAHSVDYNF